MPTNPKTQTAEEQLRDNAFVQEWTALLHKYDIRPFRWEDANAVGPATVAGCTHFFTTISTFLHYEKLTAQLEDRIDDLVKELELQKKEQHTSPIILGPPVGD